MCSGSQEYFTLGKETLSGESNKQKEISLKSESLAGKKSLVKSSSCGSVITDYVDILTPFIACPL